MENRIRNLLDANRIAILGYGREGRSSYRFIRKYFPEKEIGVFDKSEGVINEHLLINDKNCIIYAGAHYLDNIAGYDLLIKSPGISYKEMEGVNLKCKINSQSGIFLELFAKQIIGITGTKGKSTTSSLLYHVLENAGFDVVFVGNIGIPPFDEIDKIKENTYIIYELSSHQLETVEHSPHISVILNIFQEHLDHYKSYEDYKKAKMRIALFQEKGDYFIYNADNENTAEQIKKHQLKSQILSFSIKKEPEMGAFYNGSALNFKLHLGYFSYLESQIKRNLPGVHNLMNIAVVIMICKIITIEDDILLKHISTFNALPHRLEYVGNFNGKHFYNDSIATIPEAAIEAIKTIVNTDTFLTGGYDRGIDYSGFIEFILESSIENIVFMGDAGRRMHDLIITEIHTKTCFWYDNFDEAARKAIELTKTDGVCLMSPAAASYGMFNDFKERGDRFVEIIKREAKIL